MTPERAERIANVVIGVAAVGAAIVILRTPQLRRLAFQLARTALFTTAPAWAANELKNHWAATGPRRVNPQTRRDMMTA
jgi:hypothetical protein